MLIMDSSGSMKKTDPANLRKAAARLFISLLRDNDRTGLVSFSDEAQQLLDLTETGDKQKQKGLIKSLERVTSTGKYTNIYDGIQKGYEMLKPSANKERLLILMSDGQMDLGDKAREEALTKELQTALLPELKKAGIKIYTIAFTESSDRALLEDLALKTDGFFKMAQTDKDLHTVFASMFERIKSPDALPIKDNAFQVDKEIQEFTLLITKKTAKIRIAIKDPSGKEHKAGRPRSDIQWFEAKAFDMVTVKNPLSGQWSLKFSSEEGNKVFIITDLKLLSSFNKTTVTQGKPVKLEAWLTKGNEQLKAKEVLERVKISVNMKTPDGKDTALALQDDGASGDSAAGDGVYTLELPIEQQGDYNLTLTADAETFRREKVFAFKALKPAPVVVRVVEPGAGKETAEKKKEVAPYPAGLIVPALAIAVIVLTALSAYLYLLGRRYKKIAGPAKGYKEETAKETVENKGELQTEAEDLAEKLKYLEVLKGDNKRLKEVIDKQSAKITELMGYRDLLAESRQRLEAMQRGNKELMEKIGELADKAEGAEELKGLMAVLERNNKELDASVSILEEENARLTGDYEKWQAELKKIEEDREYEKMMEEAEFNRLANEKAAQEEKLRELKENLAARDMELMSLQKNYESLEKEYMALYKEHQQ